MTKFSRMGHLGLGSLELFLIALLICSSFLPGLAQEIDETSDGSGDESRTQGEPIIWFIYTSKEITDNISFELPIVINSTGELRVKDMATFELLQEADYQRNIIIKDNGTLRIHKSTLISNFALEITIKDNGKLILETGSNLKVDKLTALGNSVIKLRSSTISAGKNGLEFDIKEEATLELIDSEIVEADTFTMKDDTRLILNNGYIKSGEYTISCQDVYIQSNDDLNCLKFDFCENVYITNSKLTDLTIEYCGNLQSDYDTTIIDSEITLLGTGKLISANINNLRFNNIEELELDSCQVNILKISKKVSRLYIRNSDISQMDIESCSVLETFNTYFDNSALQQSSDSVEFHSSVVKYCSIYPKDVKIYDSTIVGNREELDDLTMAQRMDAYNSDFSAPLHFTGTSEAHLTNCSTSGEIPPKVIVEDYAKIHLYWWLEVRVLDNKSLPLPGVEISVCDFITNQPKCSGISDDSGKAKFALLANTITMKGWKTKNNKSYFVRGEYTDSITHTTTNETGIWMKQNTNSDIEFVDVKTEKSEEPQGSFFTLEMIFIIICILLIIGMLVFGFMQNSNLTVNLKRSNGNKSRSRQSGKGNNYSHKTNGSGMTYPSPESHSLSHLNRRTKTPKTTPPHKKRVTYKRVAKRKKLLKRTW